MASSVSVREREQVKSWLASAGNLQALFAKIDANHDGKVTYQVHHMERVIARSFL